MLTIKVPGPGCANCAKLESIAQQAVTNLGLEAQIEKVADYARIMAHGALSTPGLVIEERLVCSGRIPSDAEVTTWLTDALQAA